MSCLFLVLVQEVLTLVGMGLRLQFASLLHDPDAALLAEGRVREHHREALAGVVRQAVDSRLDRGLVRADAVQIEVHDAEPGGRGHDLPAPHEVLPQMALLVGIQGASVLADHIFVGGQEETAGPAGGIANGVVRPRLHAVHDGLDQFSGREVLARALRRLLGRLGQQALVDVAFHVRVHGHPVFGIDQVDD